LKREKQITFFTIYLTLFNGKNMNIKWSSLYPTGSYIFLFVYPPSCLPKIIRLFSTQIDLEQQPHPHRYTDAVQGNSSWKSSNCH